MRSLSMIPVEEPYEARQNAGEIVMNGLVGRNLEVFEVRVLKQDSGERVFSYWVNNIPVPAEVYRDCMSTAIADRFDPTLHVEQVVDSGSTTSS